jgi:hypothetical protein
LAERWCWEEEEIARMEKQAAKEKAHIEAAQKATEEKDAREQAEAAQKAAEAKKAKGSKKGKGPTEAGRTPAKVSAPSSSV